MKTRNEKMKVSALTCAVQGALAVMFAMPLVAHAEDAGDEVAAMRRPVNTVEAGVNVTSDKSTKFGEYNGLKNKDGSFIGNFSLRGGDAYDSKTGSYRYEFSGKDVGTTSREFTGSASNQGTWNFAFGYDELTHYTTNNYQTPLIGSAGGNSFVLPSIATYGVIYKNPTNGTRPLGTACVDGATNPTCVGGFQVGTGSKYLTPAQLAAMNTVDVNNTRKNANFLVGYNIDHQWSVQFDYNHLKQDGAKLMGTGSTSSPAVSNTVGPIYGNVSAAAGLWSKEANMVIMNPSNYTTDTFNLGVNWVGDSAHVHATYAGSLFKDAYNGLSWQSPFVDNQTLALALPGSFITNSISTAPSNQFHQFNLNGGFTLTPTTKLVGGISRGINKQNEAFNNDPAFLITAAPVNAAGIAQTSLNGKVVTNHADLKLTDKSIKDLALSAGLKYNERDNQSPSMRMSFQDLRSGAVGANTWRVVNTPNSNKSTLFDLGAEYRLDKGQSLRLGYEHEDIKRWCNGVLPTLAAASGAGAVAAGLNVTMPIGTIPGCVLTPSSKEDRIGLTYKMKPKDDLSIIADLQHAQRKSSTDWNFVNPLGTTGQLGTTAQFLGNGTINAGNYYGFRTYFDASRDQDLLKLRANWTATEAWSFAVAGRFENNKYNDSPLGVQNGKSLSLNFDTTYIYSEKGSISAFVSTSDRSRTNISGGASNAAALATTTSVGPIVDVNQYSNVLHETSTIIGLNLKQQLTEAWDLASDLSYSTDKSGYTTMVPYALSLTPTVAAGACGLTNVLSCGSTPTIQSDAITLNVIGGYKIDKSSKVKMAYTYQHLRSNDYYYNGYEYGSTPSATMPTNQQAPSYTQHSVGVVYIYSFN